MSQLSSLTKTIKSTQIKHNLSDADAIKLLQNILGDLEWSFVNDVYDEDGEIDYDATVAAEDYFIENMYLNFKY